MWRKFIFACSPGTGPANTRKMNLRPPCKNELTAIFVVLCGVQSLDVHVLIAQLVGAVQAQAKQIKAQAAQVEQQENRDARQAKQTKAQAAQNIARPSGSRPRPRRTWRRLSRTRSSMSASNALQPGSKNWCKRPSAPH